MMRKKTYGFTLVEVILALTIIGVIAVIALASSNLPNTIKEKRIEAMSRDFYALTESVYLTFLNHPDYANSQTQAGLVNAFRNRAGARDSALKMGVTCSNMVRTKFTTLPTSQQGNQGTCVYFPEKNIMASIKLLTTCGTNYSAINFLTKNDDGTINTTSVTRAGCGFVTYGFKDSKEGFGKDVFSIVLGRSRVL